MIVSVGKLFYELGQKYCTSRHQLQSPHLPIPPNLFFGFLEVDGSEIPKARSLCLGVRM